MQKAMNRLGSGFQTRELLKPFPGVNPKPVSANVKTYEFQIEYGNVTAFMHAHSVLVLDSKCHVDVKKAQAVLDDEFKEWHREGEHVYLNVKAFKDTKSVINAYIRKGNEDNKVIE